LGSIRGPIEKSCSQGPIYKSLRIFGAQLIETNDEIEEIESWMVNLGWNSLNLRPMTKLKKTHILGVDNEVRQGLNCIKSKV
jgi:hypothetical protein